MAGSTRRSEREEVTVAEAVQSQRAKSILQTRQEVKETRQEAKQAESYGKISGEVANIEMARAVKEYIIELEYLLRNTSAGADYWTDAEIGKWRIQQPSPVSLAWRHKRENGIGTTRSNESRQALPKEYEVLSQSQFEEQTVVVSGLQDFLEIPVEQTVSHTVTFHVEHNGTVEVTGSVTETIPEHISDEAYSLCNRYCGEIGLDIQADSGRQLSNYSKS